MSQRDDEKINLFGHEATFVDVGPANPREPTEFEREAAEELRRCLAACVLDDKAEAWTGGAPTWAAVVLKRMFWVVEEIYRDAVADGHTFDGAVAGYGMAQLIRERVAELAIVIEQNRSGN